MKETKRLDGKCPYCQSDSFSQGENRRPGQRVDECNICNKFSVLSLRSGTRYPLSIPTDVNSPPYT